MILDQRLRTAVVAINPSLCVAKLGRHGLHLDGGVEVAESHFHVDNGAGADRALEGGLGVLAVAGVVDGVAAAHEDDGLRGGEHVFAADGAVAVGRALDAAVGVADGDGEADAAGLGRCGGQ